MMSVPWLAVTAFGSKRDDLFEEETSMVEILKDLASGIEGIRAIGKISKEDLLKRQVRSYCQEEREFQCARFSEKKIPELTE
jgi:hypothetical protein